MPIFDNKHKYVVGKTKHVVKDLVIDKPYEYSSEKLELLYQHSKYLFPLLDLHKIEYFAVGGTLLGAIRHQGLIPWDNDIDIGIDYKEFLKLKELLDELNKVNSSYYWVETLPGIRIYYKDYAIVDFFVCDSKDNKYMYSYPYDDGIPSFEVHMYCFPKIIFDKNQIFPVKKVQFEDMFISVPKNHTHALFVNYNEKVLSTVITPSSDHLNMHDDHDSINLLKPRKWIVEVARQKYPEFYKIFLMMMQYKFNKSFINYNNTEYENKLKIDIVECIKKTPSLIDDIHNIYGIRNALKLIINALF